MTISTEYLRAVDLQPWSRNPKKHDRKSIQNSIKRFGFTSPVLLDEDTGRIIAGHGRVEALIALKESGVERPKNVEVDESGEWLVPVVRGLSFTSEAEAEAYLVADNRLTEIGGWDEEMLLEMLNDVQTQVGEGALLGTGFTDREIENLVRKTDVERDQGPTPVEKADGFLNAQIKQIVLFFNADDYDQVVDRLGVAMRRTGLTSNTDLILKLLADFEAQHAEDLPAEG